MSERINHKNGDLINGTLFIKEVPKISKQRRGLFECKYCKNHFEIDIHFIRLDIVKSCGCLRRRTRNPYYRSHLYKKWDKIKQRCFNPDQIGYHNYGGRGITMHGEWVKNPVAFIEYCMTLPGHDNESLTIDRINNDGNYEPGNIRFVTQSIQLRNRRPNPCLSGYVGVSVDKRNGRFISYIGVKNKRKHIGCYSGSIEAARARDQYIIDNNLEGFNLQVL